MVSFHGTHSRTTLLRSAPVRAWVSSNRRMMMGPDLMKHTNTRRVSVGDGGVAGFGASCAHESGTGHGHRR